MKADLQNFEVYKKFPFLVPFIGKNYEGKTHKKLLLVGESHYLPPESTFHLNAKKWYNESVRLSEKEDDWCNTQKIGSGNCSSKFLKTINPALCRVLGINESNNWAFQEVAYYNYFLRPAKYEEGQCLSLKATPLDKELAIKNLHDVLNILRPDLFFLLGRTVVCAAEGFYPKYFHQELWDYTTSLKITYKYIYHPSRFWDTRCHPRNNPEYFDDKKTCDYFCDYLKENWIRK